MACRSRALAPRAVLVARAVASSTLLLLLLLQAPAAHALVLSLDLDYEFSGGMEPAGPSPWVRITFDDSFGGPNDVRLTIAAVGLVGIESVDGVYLNFDPALDPTGLGFTVVNDAASPPSSIHTGTNAFRADGDGYFDILFDLVPPGSEANRLTAGESIVFDLSYGSPISVSSFDFSSVMGGGNGTYQAAAHIQRIGAGEDSGWIGPVPEPSTGVLLGLGLVLAARSRERAQRGDACPLESRLPSRLPSR